MGVEGIDAVRRQGGVDRGRRHLAHLQYDGVLLTALQRISFVRRMDEMMPDVAKAARGVVPFDFLRRTPGFGPQQRPQ